ncbi:MAG TPA: GyrI-like domain-containing protein, partial [Saprospiraceae bacterium]|nr:GyrI-like domain-containing protein [Saprospiraceae bacterium]
EKFEIPASKMLLINYQGGYNGLGEAHYAMDDYIKEKGYKISSPVVEEYVTDPGNEPDSTKWVTKVMYFVEK